MYGRMSPEQVQELRRMARERGEEITIVGGWVETEQGVYNRVAAYEKYGEGMPAPEYGLDRMDYGRYTGDNVKDISWRNTGAPESGLPGKEADLDIWTRRDRGRFTAPSKPVQQQLKDLFEVAKIDNYNRHWGYGPPAGAVTFNPNGTVTRNIAPWQQPPH